MATVPTTDGSLTLESSVYGESYRSRHGALSESRHVFLDASGVLEALSRRSAEATATATAVRVLEVGFGTGLNFLVTACAVLDTIADEEPSGVGGTNGRRLHYTALENDPPALAAVASLDYSHLLSPCRLPDELLRWWRGLGEPLTPGSHRFATSEAARVELELLITDARGYLAAAEQFDAIYLDPFSPKANPELWTEPFLAPLAAALKPGGRLVTYSVSGAVRRTLEGAGLRVTKVPGPPGGKREVLSACRPKSR